jgi:hypothetical protein
MLRRTRVLVAALALAAGLAPVAVVTASASAAAAPAPYCGIRWGSLAKNATPTTQSHVTNLRAGRHGCYDRLVFDVRGGNVTGYHVQYVGTVYEDPTGRVVPLRGGAKLQVVADAPSYDLAGRLTYHFANRAELVNVSGYRTFRQVAWAGSFEGQTNIGLGVRARLPFRVFTLPGRLVVDVAHLW